MSNQCLAASVLSFVALCCCAAAQAIPVPAPPQLAAKSYVLMDANSGQILAASNPDQKTEPASLTKLMTAYVVFHALKDGVIALDTPVTISVKAWRMGGSRTFAKVGSQVSVENLIQGMVVQSGNDATVALAERVGGTEDTFVELMNKYAQQLGMNNSHFVDASGLTDDPAHHVTARDIAILSRAIIREFPEYYHFFSEKEFTWNNIHQRNRNDLLFTDPSVDGLKTGYTDEAGYCLVASATRNGMRLIGVVMGTKRERDRAIYDQALLNYGFNFYDSRKLYDAGASVAQLKVWKGSENSVPVGTSRDFYVTYPKGQYDKLNAAVHSSAGLIAPIQAGQPVGTVTVTLDGKQIAQAPLVTLKAVPEGGIFTRMFDSIRLWFHKK
ncbi:MAG TPA: D-alanyl-D-alanine carboxypeptidase family protein [Gammaproteobacteria bacterium]|nr:D-alanyl-D-alanine carboxypeptidase family protein [Gammaproteobacteria bacterium]